MQNKLSSLAIIVVGIVYFSSTFLNFKNASNIKVTTWDALGYYMYLPASFIYNDLQKLSFYPEIEKKYELQGRENEFYQFSPIENGNYTGKYFVGISVMQSPFFILAHLFSKMSSQYSADGFSTPYQISIILAALFYLLLGLIILRKTLLLFYEEKVVTLTILLLALSSNLIQYASIDVGQSHVYLFCLYSLIIYLSIKWHQSKTKFNAFIIGTVVGLATISRPTEIIILFIPLLWLINNKSEWNEKVSKLFKGHWQILYTGLGFLLLLSIQLLYWKYSTGSFVYNVGSKWHFFNPHWRVLFGFEKGWFIYTPITIFFVIGLFFVKNSQFKTSLIVFCLLNIWIVISWADWRYGGSYSTRALVQSYPVFALGFASLISCIEKKKLKPIFYAVGIYLIVVNLFQIYQYNTGILHYDKMNYKYYKEIYLNPNVTELEKQLLSD